MINKVIKSDFLSKEIAKLLIKNPTKFEEILGFFKKYNLDTTVVLAYLLKKDFDNQNIINALKDLEHDSKIINEIENLPKPDKKPSECHITKDRYLQKSCNKQNTVSGSKCYKDKCHKVLKVLSITNRKDPNFNAYGHVVSIKISGKYYVVKWNRQSKLKMSVKNEILIQEMAAKENLAPKILTYYEDQKHYYIIMEDIVKKGFIIINSITEHLDEMFIAIDNALTKLHNLGIVHNDLHSNNIFYNPKTKKVLFIDYGISQLLSRDTSNLIEKENIMVFNENKKRIEKDIRRLTRTKTYLKTKTNKN